MISFKTSDCRQKCGDFACKLQKLTAVTRDYWWQRGQEKSSCLYRCCHFYGECDCTYGISTAESNVRSNKRTDYGAGRTDTVRHFPYGVRLTPYQAGTMCATRPPHSHQAAALWGLHAPNPPWKELMYMGKDIRISVRLTDKEKQSIQAKAKKCGLSTTEYVKQRALGYEPRTVPPSALFVLLEKIGTLEEKSSSAELNDEISSFLKQISVSLLLPGKEKS